VVCTIREPAHKNDGLLTGELLSGYVPNSGVGVGGASRYDRCRRFLATFAQGLAIRQFVFEA
jgi:hypothetical protein